MAFSGPRTWTTDIHTDPHCCMATGPDMALSISMGWDLTMAWGVAGQPTPVRLFPHYPHISRSSPFIAHKPFYFSSSPISLPLAHCSAFRLSHTGGSRQASDCFLLRSKKLLFLSASLANDSFQSPWFKKKKNKFNFFFLELFSNHVNVRLLKL